MRYDLEIWNFAIFTDWRCTHREWDCKSKGFAHRSGVKHTFDIYGSPESDIEKLRIGIESLLEIQMEARESSFWGVYYTAKAENKGTFTLRANYNESAREWNFERWKDFAHLLYVTTTAEPSSLEKRFENTGFKLLKRMVV